MTALQSTVAQPVTRPLTDPTARQRWQLIEPDAAAVAELVVALDLPPLVARILVNRGHAEVDSARRFLQPDLAILGDPYRMADAEAAAERLATAVIKREHVCIYGDYDVDGVSASALMHRFLSAVGAPPRVFLPDRFRDGYGLNQDRLVELCETGVQLFVAVDCGSNAHAAIAEVRRRGCDFIVCDHHQLGDTLPDVNALMNPRRTDCSYPDKGLSAVGVAMVLAQATRRKLSDKGYFTGAMVSLGGLLPFAALGTIADMVPLQGVNRALAWHGLRALGRSRDAGIVALAAKARLDGVTRADHVGFRLGPRINAAGRVADARTAFELLTTDNAEHANVLAERVELENNRRRVIQKQVAEQALAAAEAQPGNEHAVVIADPGWHAGVVGIVAARVKDRFAVPTFVLSIEDGVARGSGRSIDGYDLVAGLRRVADAGQSGLFARFGGHYFAAGVTLDVEHVDAFREALIADVAAELPVSERVRVLRVEAEVQVTDITLDLADQLDALEPFGRGNPRPLLLLSDVVVANKRLLGQEQAWARLRLVENNDRPLWGRRGADVFSSAHDVAHLADGDGVSAVVRVGRNCWNGRTTVQLTPVAFGLPNAPIEVVAPQMQEN